MDQVIDQQPMIGGIFTIAIFWHFVVHYLIQARVNYFQSFQDETQIAWTSVKYSIVFLAPFIGMSMIRSQLIMTIATLWVWSTHYVITSGWSTKMWLKHSENAMSGGVKIDLLNSLFHIVSLFPLIEFIVLRSM